MTTHMTSDPQLDIATTFDRAERKLSSKATSKSAPPSAKLTKGKKGVQQPLSIQTSTAARSQEVVSPLPRKTEMVLPTPLTSYYFPSCRRLLTVTKAVADLLEDNNLLKSDIPEYNSVMLYTYVDYLFIYRILLVLHQIGPHYLSDDQREVHHLLTRIGPPTEWPVPEPIVDFIYAIGAFRQGDLDHSWILPTIPQIERNVGKIKQVKGLRGMHQIPHLQRLVQLPAHTQFLRKIGARHVCFVNETLTPTSNDEGRLTATHPFLGLTHSTTDNQDFQALAYSDGWLAPAERNSSDWSSRLNHQATTVQGWSIRQSDDPLRSLADFTSLSQPNSALWIEELKHVIQKVCQYFPGSKPLAEISPFPPVQSLAKVELTFKQGESIEHHKWYYTQDEWNISIKEIYPGPEVRFDQFFGPYTTSRVTIQPSVVPAWTQGPDFFGLAQKTFTYPEPNVRPDYVLESFKRNAARRYQATGI